MSRQLVLAISLIAVGGIAACGPAQSAALQPVQVGAQLETEKAVERSEDSYVETTTDQWPGDEAVTRYATPVHVLVRNDGERPIRVALPFFKLVGQSGRAYDALPVVAIEERAKPPIIEGSNFLLSPEAVAEGNQLNPNPGPIYDEVIPETATNRYRLGYSIDYTKTQWAYWHEHDFLPTKQMQWYALRERVLEPGDAVQGYIYFERVDDEARAVQLQIDIVDAETGEGIERVSIPYLTE